MIDIRYNNDDEIVIRTENDYVIMPYDGNIHINGLYFVMTQDVI